MFRRKKSVPNLPAEVTVTLKKPDPFTLQEWLDRAPLGVEKVVVTPGALTKLAADVRRMQRNIPESFRQRSGEAILWAGERAEVDVLTMKLLIEKRIKVMVGPNG